ncbi:hypothetical protein [Streptomyces albireticuli]|uniref:Uncharacterized protein n=1 Tax=Streptomyces albireticuli TaxID=1940 RepID=A0A2A2D7W5_9ACTN|nr:hypothetical protein [Streptomyces albireticuli]MCD9144335.1 hypothetical protein [Streptomyces albireticuli]MCD9162022.1 hypothetical protein [Streptomyces albireticuli]MCD9193972.1 hypothetical protein [Streptomyces albireticuli]PAU47537.1 hypothetical protein CK936_18280 [Streptomyces albireticuli]
MKLAIGDVVQGHHEVALGTVAGITDHGDGKLVVVRVPGGGLRLLEPNALTLIARRTMPVTRGRSVATLIALIAAFIGCRSADDLGADWLLTVLAGLGSFKAVVIAYQCWLHLTGPRRFRV